MSGAVTHALMETLSGWFRRYLIIHAVRSAACMAGGKPFVMDLSTLLTRRVTMDRPPEQPKLVFKQKAVVVQARTPREAVKLMYKALRRAKVRRAAGCVIRAFVWF